MHYRPVKRCPSCPSYTPDDPDPLDLRYHLTGRCWDILRDLAEVGSFPESHASPPANNNKRTYGSDKPAESPPDNTSKQSPSDRGPIASSKRISLSLGSSPLDATSVLHGTTTSSPVSPTPGSQEIRGDLSILSVRGSASTSEKTDGSDSSSPSTLTRIFEGDTIPTTTNDLGRLPLHHGVKFPTNFDFGQVANEWNAARSEPSSGLSQRGLNARGTQAGVIFGLHPPQENSDLFPWMVYTTMMEGKEVPTDSVPTLANPNQTQQTADRLDSTISSFFGDVPSSFTALGQTASALPGPASNAAEDHADLFALFPPSDPPVGPHPPMTVQDTQQPRQGHEERGYESLPIDTQAYLHGWSNVPQAFE